jgi:acyl carrier protein
MSISEIELFNFLTDQLGVNVSSISRDSALFSSGVIDSFALITFMTFLEAEAGIRISPADVNLSNFDSITRILNYLDRVSN